MIDKVHLFNKEYMFLAQKSLISNIYYTARIEGVNVAFPQTKTILEEVSVSNLKGFFLYII
jgi:hypothetical protein